MICTFYSYKGGVGRTLALANLAELFYQAGLRVVAVDWDLTAPGLESYFPTLDREKTLDHPGLIDMLLQYKEYMSDAPVDNTPLALESPSRYLIPVYADGFAPGSLHLLTAGRRPSDQPLLYPQAVLTFDWQEFYDMWEGERYFTWLCAQFAELADIVLLDCRAGFSEMGNVCTYHLADVVVLFCAPDQQNLEGAYAMAQQFTSAKVRQVRADDPLKVIIVPSRIEEQAGEAERLRWKYEFVRRFNAQHFADAVDLITTGEAMWALRIPQVPSSALLDPLPVRQPPSERHAGLYQAYRLLVETVTLQAAAQSRIHEFIKVHVLHNRQVSAAQAGTAPARWPLEALVKTCCEVYLRPTPGYIHKPLQEAVRLDQGVYAKIVDGPQSVDGVCWWLIVCKLEASTAVTRSLRPFAAATDGADRDIYTVRGWVAETTPNGLAQLQRLERDPLDQEISFLF